MITPPLLIPQIAKLSIARFLISFCFGRLYGNRYQDIINTFHGKYGLAMAEGIAKAKEISGDNISLVVDCGTGTGFVTKQAAEQFPKATFIAFDILPGMLTQARNNCKDIPTDIFYVQADTFALLRQDIAQVVNESTEKAKVELQLFLAEQAAEEAQKATSKVKEGVKAYEKLGEDVRQKVNALTQEVKTMHSDLESVRQAGMPAKTRFLSLGLSAIGVVMLLGVLAKFFLDFGATLTIDSVIITVVLGLVGAVCVFLGSQM